MSLDGIWNLTEQAKTVLCAACRGTGKAFDPEDEEDMVCRNCNGTGLPPALTQEQDRREAPRSALGAEGSKSPIHCECGRLYSIHAGTPCKGEGVDGSDGNGVAIDRKANQKPGELWLYDRADGVRGHFCVGRTMDGFCHEYWNEEEGRFCAFGTLYKNQRAANAKLRDLEGRSLQGEGDKP